MKHDIYDMTFRRRFSINPLKSLRLALGEMSCGKDWVNTRRGDPYPVICGNEREDAQLAESLPDGRYRAYNRSDEALWHARLLGQHFPYATYEIEIDELAQDDGACMGVQIFARGEPGSAYDAQSEPRLCIAAGVSGGHVYVMKALHVGGCAQPMERVYTDTAFVPGLRLMVASRGMFFDVYLETGNVPKPICTFAVPQMAHILKYHTFVRSTAVLYVSLEPGKAAQGAASFYLDGGVSHADMKCMRTEDGMPIMENGRLFLTMSSRLAEGSFQSVISWNPSGADLRMEGALFFDYGDDAWCSDVASSVVYDRKAGQWYVWACAFSHGHVLCRARSFADLRHGIHVLDAQTMPAQRREKSQQEDSLSAAAGGAQQTERALLSDDTLFYGKYGDEDPDLVYDAARGKWLLAICRLTGESGAYRYHLFESDNPLTGFSFVDRTRVGANTGGSIIRVNGKLYLLCGADFDKRARYQLHPIEDLSQHTLLAFDYDDGGFRGWGTLIPVPCGSRTRYMLMTFDRHNGSDYNWSYGNLYVFEADCMNDGWEWADSLPRENNGTT